VVGGCLKIKYTGSEDSCLLLGDATAKTLTSTVGAAGSEAVDTNFGTAGVLDLTGATVDTLTELAAVIEAYDDYTASVHYGDDIPTENIVTATVQAKTPLYGYVLFDLDSVLDTYALTTWARTKYLLNLPDTDQTLVEYLINTASEAAEYHARRKLAARAYTSDLDGPGGTRLILPNYPINSITSIYEDEDRSFAAASEVDSTYYGYYSDEGFVERYTGTWTTEKKALRITYNAGLSTVPSRLQDAVIEVVAWNLKRFRGSGIGIRSISAPDGMNTAMETTIPLNALRVFESYRDGRQ
jgi:hypothetical protein